MQYKKQKSILFAVCFTLFLAVFCCFSTIFTANATDETPPATAEATQFKAPSGYFYFDEPSTIFASDANLYIAEKNCIDVFSLGEGENSKIATTHTIKKLAEHANKLVTLVDDTIKIDGVDIDGSYADFSVYDGNIYAVCGAEIILYNISTATKTTLINLPSSAKKIAAHDGRIYLSISNSNNSKYDDILLYEPLEGVEWGLKASAKSVEYNVDLEVIPSEKSVVGLLNSKIVKYTAKGSELIMAKELPANNLVQTSVNGSFIYALTDSKKVVKTDFLLSGLTDVFASANSGDGYYNLPCNVASKKGSVAICDEFNDRVIVTLQDKTVTIPNLRRPKAVATDNNGNYFIADYVSEINKYSTDFVLQSSAKLTSPDNASIKDMKFDSRNNLYVLCENGALYKIAYGTSSFEAQNTTPIGQKIVAFDISLDTDAIYIATATEISLLVSGKQVATSTEQIKDFCIDHDNAIYVLSSNANVVKYVGGLATALPAITGLRFGAASIAMNTLTSEIYAIEYGDLIITDTNTHSVKIIKKNILQVNKNFKIDTDVKLPPVTDPPILDAADTRKIIYSITDNTSVYAGEAEIYQLATLYKGVKVIIPEYDSSKKFNFIIADNIAKGKEALPVVGYVLTSYIASEAVEYTASHPQTCHTYIDNVAIYAYPTRNSPKYPNYTKLPKNTQLNMLDFCSSGVGDSLKYGYTDNFSSSTIWYKVSFGDKNYVGYVPSDFISVRGANPDLNIYPQTNAKIKSKDKNSPNVGALCYNKATDGSFVVREDLQPIPVDTKIEVVGSFNTSKPYTQIKYLTEYGTIEVWIETANIAYDGINVVQIVAIVLIIITFIIIGLIVCRVLYLKSSAKAIPTR